MWCSSVVTASAFQGTSLDIRKPFSCVETAEQVAGSVPRAIFVYRARIKIGAHFGIPLMEVHLRKGIPLA